MTITVEAMFENGVLKPSQPLPLPEQEKVLLTVRRGAGAADQMFGIIGWSGDAATFERLLRESEAGDGGFTWRGDEHGKSIPCTCPALAHMGQKQLHDARTSRFAR